MFALLFFSFLGEGLDVLETAEGFELMSASCIVNLPFSFSPFLAPENLKAGLD
jgi:hypothetical protein